PRELQARRPAVRFSSFDPFPCGRSRSTHSRCAKSWISSAVTKKPKSPPKVLRFWTFGVRRSSGSADEDAPLRPRQEQGARGPLRRIERRVSQEIRPVDRHLENVRRRAGP